MKLANVFSRKNRILLAELVRTDFKLRYQDSALGYLWSILNPLLLFAILYTVFVLFMGFGNGIPHYPIYLLLGIILWRFFVEATNNGLNAIVARGSLIRKINFPHYIIVVSGTMSSLINLFINMMVVAVFMAIEGVPLTAMALMAVPLVLELYVFALALAFFLSAINVKFRDTGYLWEVFLQVAFYATPIIYPISMVVEKSLLAAQIIVLNPVAQVIQDARYVLVTDTTTTPIALFGSFFIELVPIITIITTIAISALYFKKKSSRFAEEV